MFLFFSVFCIFHDKINELSHLFGCVGSVILLWNRVNYTLGGDE